MSENDSESDLDFSASEDEYIPTADDDDSVSESDDDVDDDDDGDKDGNEPKSGSSKKIKNIKRKRTARKNTEDDDDSDSSVENYLLNPNEIDLGSEFFNPNKVVASNVPQFDCNVGLNLTDDSEEEVFEAVPSTSQDAVVVDFNAHENFNKNLENAKEQLRNFKSTNFGHDNSVVDVKQLLEIGEPSLVAKKSLKSKRKDVVSSDESDFEEVEEDVKTNKKNDVEVRIGPDIKQKPNKLQADIEASIKRKINRMKKEKQLMMHKVHLLSWIAYGNFVNKVLNSTSLMEMVVKYIPSVRSYPKDETDQNYFEQICRWYKTTVGLKTKEQNCNLKCLPPIATSLALQIQSKMAICKKDFVFIFIVLLRSMGIQCRLVINLATLPMRPAAKDLCVISTTKTEKPKSSDKVKQEKKPTKKVKETSSGKSKPKAANLKGLPSSIIGKKSAILPKSPDTKSIESKTKPTLRSSENQSSNEPNDAKKKSLKRSISVQSISSVNDNNKRIRIKNSNDASHAAKAGPSIQNDNSKNNLKRRSMSVQSPSSINNVSKMSSIQPKSGRMMKTKAAHNKVIASPIARRTRKRSSTVTSQSIPQLDGGDDKKSKKRKTDLFKIKFPLRARSVSPSSTSEVNQRRTKSVALQPRGRAKSNTVKFILPSDSRSMSKSPTAHVSRKSKFEKVNSNASTSSSSSPAKSLSKSENDSKTNEADTEEPKMNSEKSKRVQASKPSNSTAVIRAAASVSPVKTKSNTEDQKKNSRVPKAVKSSSKLPAPLSSTTSVRSNSATKTMTSSKKTNSKTRPSTETSLLSNSTELSKLPQLTSKVKSKPIEKRSTNLGKPAKSAVKRKSTTNSASSDSDFIPTPKKKPSPAIEKPLPKQVENLKKRIDRRILSTDDESIEPAVKKDDMNYWIEVYCEAESKWICIDLFKMKVNCVDEIKKKATKPIVYVFAWNNNNKIKDVSPRYCSQWNTTTRKLRVQTEWLDAAIYRYKEPLSQRCVAEDRELEEIHAQTPIPTTLSELKNHPLYVITKHLLKFEGLFPPNSVPVGYIRDEPIYSRLCVHTLHSREIWVKQARVVKPAEIPYKIVKARPKWDRLANKMLEPQPLEIFGRWQTDPYVPPTAENGIVPRNAYGNVELFKPEMLPKNTVHLRLAGLNRVCAKLKIDCAQAVVGFDFHGGSSHPTFDGFVVCEEFAELVTERWCEEQEEAYRKSKEKQNQRIYDNWKKLVKGLIIRERLQRKYNFAGKGASTSSSKLNKSVKDDNIA